LLAHFDGLVLEAYNGWSSCASTDLFEINVLLIIADDLFSSFQSCSLGVFRPGTLFNDTTRVGTHPKANRQEYGEKKWHLVERKKKPRSFLRGFTMFFLWA